MWYIRFNAQILSKTVVEQGEDNSVSTFQTYLTEKTIVFVNRNFCIFIDGTKHSETLVHICFISNKMNHIQHSKTFKPAAEERGDNGAF